jgi:CHAD domain-containing protein
MKRVASDPSDENVHDWRKRAKDLWYHVRLVRRAWPGLLKETADEAHELADLLGDHHDLAVLRDDVREDPAIAAASDELARLLDAIDERQGELLEKALGLGARLYAEKPKAYGIRLRKYWNAPSE